MVVGRQCHASQALALSIVGHLGRNLIDIYLLEDGIHRLGCIHRNGLLGLGTDLFAISVLPLHELITKVLVGSNGNLITLVEHNAIRSHSDATSLVDVDAGGQAILYSVLRNTREGTLDNNVGIANLLGVV